MTIFLKLSRPALIGLATALESGRLSAPYSLANIEDFVPGALCQEVVDELNRLHTIGVTPIQIAYTLNLLAAERAASQQVGDRIELVWTGLDGISSESRNTGIVVRELFSTAKNSVLISSFAIDKGEKARALFQVLAERMDSSTLQVRMFLNVQRPHHNEEPESVLLKKFADIFCQEIWPGERLPEVFHDPRSLAVGTESKACLHAKCVVVDEAHVLVTSANFTEAAHERNIEAGVLITDLMLARGVRSQFETLVTKKLLRRIPGIS